MPPELYIKKGTLEEGSRTANETWMKCAVNLYSLESFHLPKLGVSCCLSGSRPCRPQNAFILCCNHTYLTFSHKLRVKVLFTLRPGWDEILLILSTLLWFVRNVCQLETGDVSLLPNQFIAIFLARNKKLTANFGFRHYDEILGHF